MADKLKIKIKLNQFKIGLADKVIKLLFLKLSKMNMDAHLSPLRCNKLIAILLNYPETASTKIPSTLGSFQPWSEFAKIHGMPQKENKNKKPLHTAFFLIAVQDKFLLLTDNWSL